jgi:hypothetical protein
MEKYTKFFKNLLQNQMAKFNQTWYKLSLGKRNSDFQIKGQVLFKGDRDNHKNVKMGWGHLKIFSRTRGPILTKLGTNHPWREGIQVCSKEGGCPSPRGDNSERVKIY